ncbi:Chemotaxis response regulator protein-glutamate methylesterase [compost metagenome]
MTIPDRLPQHLLVVDDSDLQRRFMVELCRAMGIEDVLEAEDGFEAIQALRTYPQIEAIVLDLEMPGMDGVQVLHELANLGLDPAVIVASARESTLLNVVESLGKSLGLRLLGVLQKPVLMEQLASSLSRFSVVQLRSEGNDAGPPGPELSVQDVQRALGDGEFVAYFQPKVTLRDGMLRGVEALVRWQHPQHGLLTPNHFMDLIERS